MVRGEEVGMGEVGEMGEGEGDRDRRQLVLLGRA
jgi:hypothetical protein